MPTVSKNIFWSTITSFLQLYTGSIVFIVLAKLMTISDFGILSFGFSLASIAVVVADFGFSLMIMKDYPQQRIALRNYIQGGLLAKFFTSIIIGSLFLIYLSIFYDGQWFLVGSIYIIFALLSSYIIYFQALLKINNKFQTFTVTNVVYSAAITLAVIIYWGWGLNLIQIVILLLFAKLLQFIWIILVCRNSLSRFKWKGLRVKRLIGKSWSFGVFNILGIFYFMLDTQLISLYLGSRDVALYQAVFRILLILMVFSDILSNVLLPYLSFKFYNNEKVGLLVNKLFLYLLVIGTSLFLVFTSFKTELLQFLYTPEYIEAVALILPFGLVIILRTLSTLLGNILTISDKHLYRVVTVSISLLLSVLLNIMFLPEYGIIGSAWISALVHLVLFGMYFYYCKAEIKEIKILTPTNLVICIAATAIYWVIHYGMEPSMGTIIVFILIWLLLLTILMRFNNNWRYLMNILKEKGVG